MMMMNIKKITKIIKSRKIKQHLNKSLEKKSLVHLTTLLIKIPF